MFGLGALWGTWATPAAPTATTERRSSLEHKRSFSTYDDAKYMLPAAGTVNALALIPASSNVHQVCRLFSCDQLRAYVRCRGLLPPSAHRSGCQSRS